LEDEEVVEAAAAVELPEEDHSTETSAQRITH
jgi:hypothetical protein